MALLDCCEVTTDSLFGGLDPNNNHTGAKL